MKEYIRPADWPSAVAALGRADTPTRPLVISPRPEALDDLNAEAVLDLARLDLAYVKQSGGTLAIGGLTPLQTLIESEAAQAVADGLLALAAELAGGRGLRQLASVAGALMPSEGPPEMALALLALDAELELRGPTSRVVALADWQPAPGELLAEVRLKTQPDVNGSLQRVARTPRDQAIVAVAVTLRAQGGVCQQARVALAGAAPAPRRLPEVEQLLNGQTISPELLQQAAQAASAAAGPVADYRGSAAYRRSLAGTLTSRAIAQAWKRSGA